MSRPEGAEAGDGREAKIVAAARRGDPDAVEQLVRAHWDGAHRVAWMILGDAQTAEDVAQEALLAVVGSLTRFDGRRPLAAYVHRVASNRALDVIRARAARPPQADGHDGADARAPDPSPAPLSDPLQTALCRLAPDDRAAIVLRYHLGYRAAEIGEMLSMPASTVRTRLHRARLVLRAELEAAGVR